MVGNHPLWIDDGYPDPARGEQAGERQPGRAGTYDDDVVIRRCGRSSHCNYPLLGQAQCQYVRSTSAT